MELDCIKLGFGPVYGKLPNEPESIHFMQWLYHFPVVSVTKEIWLHLISTQLLCEATRQTFQSENESTSSSRPILPCDILQRILSWNRGWFGILQFNIDRSIDDIKGVPMWDTGKQRGWRWPHCWRRRCGCSGISLAGEQEQEGAGFVIILSNEFWCFLKFA